MSTIKTNTVENIAGTNSLSVDDIGYPLSTAWGGTLLTTLTTPTLASVGIVGLNPIAYVYPDGTIVGESDNGSFVKYANGNLECSYFMATSLTATIAVGSGFYALSGSLTYPMVFTALFTTESFEKETGGIAWVTVSGTPTTSAIALAVVSTGSGSTAKCGYKITGRWK